MMHQQQKKRHCQHGVLLPFTWIGCLAAFCFNHRGAPMVQWHWSTCLPWYLCPKSCITRIPLHPQGATGFNCQGQQNWIKTFTSLYPVGRYSTNSQNTAHLFVGLYEYREYYIPPTNFLQQHWFLLLDPSFSIHVQHVISQEKIIPTIILTGFLLREMKTSIPKNRRTGVASPAQPSLAWPWGHWRQTPRNCFETFEETKSFQIFVDSFIDSQMLFFEMKEIDEKYIWNVKNQINSFCKCKFQTFRMGVTSGPVAHVHSKPDPNLHSSEASMSSTSISSKGDNSSSSSTISTNPGMLAVGLRKLWISKRGGSGICDTILRTRDDASNRFEIQHWSVWEVEILPYVRCIYTYMCTLLYYLHITYLPPGK